ncbi:site-specific DNA-methyltransferase [candidate division KSB1 bacterium]|nr:MAG: site-specific DNA-methyltransferase [candidate division KSB1 bacterium]
MSTYPDLFLTNHEKKVSAYSRKDQPTDPATVTPKTPLSTLNLNWREKDLPERFRTKHVHRLHPYLGKFIPQIVEIFLRKYFSPGQTILDPFCGSGTALVQANELGMNAIGYDVSAFNVMLCKAKLARYNPAIARDELMDILESVRAVIPLASKQGHLWKQVEEELGLSETDNSYLKTWFAPEALHQLLTYRRFIDTRAYKYKDLLRVVLSRSARSARLTTHFDLDFPKKPQNVPYWCYKHSRTCVPTTDAFKFMHRYTIDTVQRIQQFSSIRTDSTVDVRHADSRRARFPKIDGVITSPPYVGLIDYHEQHAYAYHLLGLVDARHNEIGPAVGGSSQVAKEQYVQDIASVFCRASDAMTRGGRMIVIAHDKAYLYSKIAQLVGVKVEAVVERHVNRRTGRRSNEFFESVFVWKKP